MIQRLLAVLAEFCRKRGELNQVEYAGQRGDKHIFWEPGQFMALSDNEVEFLIEKIRSEI